MFAAALRSRLSFSCWLMWLPWVTLLSFSTACSRGGMVTPPDDVPATDMTAPHDVAMPPDLAAPRRPSALYVVAHEDDELLFMNPTMDLDIQRGVETTTLFLTAGDAGNPEAYWKRREEGVRAAHALLARANNDWIEDKLTVGERLLTRFSLRSDPGQRLLFLRLPDGNGDGSGFFGNGSLQDLWEGKRPALAPKDGAPGYSQSELFELLAAILSTMQPDHLHIQDSTNLYAPAIAGGDHSDHVHAARFAFAASLRVFRPHGLWLHRGYNIAADREGVASADSARKWGIFAAYAPYDMCFGAADPSGCLTTLQAGDYGRWCERESVVHRLSGVRAALGGPTESCLYAAASAGAALELRTCDDTDGQLFDILPSGQVRGPAGLCFRPRGGATSDGTPVELVACQEDPTQSFRLLSSGQVMGPGGKCLDIKGGGGAEGTPVQLKGCEQTPGQIWVMRRRMPFFASVGAEFSDIELGSDAALARTMRLADVNRDKIPDACIRKTDGLYCSLGDGKGKFAMHKKWSQGQDFADAAGFAAPSWGLTLQLADVDGDGRADACARTATGLRCALSQGTSFGAAQRFSQGTDFGDSDGSTASEAGYYGSIRLGDINGDGRADACLRKVDGVYCAHSLGLTFAPATRFTEGFSDAEGWRPAHFGSTLMLGDVNGDGRADLCGRGSHGIMCILTTLRGDSFFGGSFWSFRGAFGNTEGWETSLSLYGSVRLSDIDGDGKADVCGRSPNGLVCSISTGQRFGPLLRIGALEFADSGSWRADRYGPTLQLADFDGDGRADVCGRGTNGLLCIRTATKIP
jgi:LmbE family N-acetylglucosaminyl deacetylase